MSKTGVGGRRREALWSGWNRWSRDPDRRPTPGRRSPPVPRPRGRRRGGKPGPRPAAEDEKASFVAVVLADTEDVWNALFQELGASYQEPHLRLFTGAVNTEGCGFAEAAVGPFYCPADSRIYLDLSFFRALHERLGAPGDFAEAYVIAHEVGHHVQNLLGTSDDIAARRGQATPEVANRLSVRLELQADYLAGVWAHHARAELGVLEGETSRRRFAQRARSATTACSVRAAAGCDRIPSRTGHPSSACGGSGAASKAAIQAQAIRSGSRTMNSEAVSRRA